MNYNELPIEEKMEHAKNYAFLLKDDFEKTPEMIIDELSSMFNLPIKKAEEAYLQSQKENSDIYKKANNSKNIHYLISLLAMLCIGAFYFFLAKEVGWIFYILVFIFGLAFVGFFSLLTRNIKQNLIIKNPNYSRVTNKWFTQTLPIVTIIFGITIWSYFFNKVLTQQDLTVIKGVLTSKITTLKDDGRNPKYFYSINLREYLNEFRFYNYDYQYCFDKLSLNNYRIGDTIELEMDKKYIPNLHYNKYVNIVGYKKNGKTTINYDLRFTEQKDSREIFTFVTSIAFVLNLLIFVLGYFRIL